MLLKEGLGRLEIFLNDELADVRLSPKERKRASDLRIRVQILLRLLVRRRAVLPNHDLLQLDEVCHEAALVDPPMQKPSAASVGAAPGDQD